MIGLEYILNVYGIMQKDLAEELGIKRQNITSWISKKQNISKKYLPVLSEKFNLPMEYFQKEITEMDKIIIEKNFLKKHIETSMVVYEDAIWDEETNSYQKIESKHYDIEAIDRYNLIEKEEQEFKLLNKIKSVIDNNIDENGSIDSYISQYDLKIKLFERFTDIVESQDLNDGFIFEILRAIELCIPMLAKKNKVLGEGRIGTSSVEDEREMTAEIYKILKKYNSKN